MAKTVAEIMTSDPLVAMPDTPLKEAIQLLADNRISGLPVVDSDGKAVGELSETDLMWQASGATLPAYIMLLDSVIYLTNPGRYNQELHKALGQTVADVMSHKAHTIGAKGDLKKAAQIMHDEQVRRLIVVDENDKVVGILTRGDIVREMASSYGQGAPL
ncbi:MAG: CBS domain-containing protein [Leptolyngbya sp. SIO4C1]|nr:CBS domain-containing protein [Leptolyngbya sp. SIO4C1]